MSYDPPLRAVEYIFYRGLIASAAPSGFQVNPTLSIGDVKVSKDGGAFANLTTLPAVTPAGGKAVKITLSATEMTADNVVVLFSDAAGAEWNDQMINLRTTTQQLDSVVPDSIPADGSRPTPAQALYFIMQWLCERVASGTTMTVRKPDGVTALATFTLNDASEPTSVTRAT